ncbi:MULTISPECIES: TIGR02328 family protein [unclassified Enterococcus]|uniref:TIGR02328 family protein n=1 Tax=unclassified Enterococcus TaxID=2608891 RepID=UPI001555FF9A|nr:MULTISPECIES: TIGR02328 family protein [unclassified Enterococcus]MBS7577755.1 TIGR02328 family protein [Enterococcus sp. MMGLQ5-2]MBS7584051.1 TIGR02328 family protein [Enterococcus sp. MMGLQ5-1]NPD11912.1 hypothetical protein [Enterococcus sp. MMGLQ5-1]NPD37585.1 hypothetical protein [Enterococcus sp. MMGLQ5-2]
MRLWHQELIRKLPRAQLLGQHRECCALRGNGWGKKHSTVNYVFKYSPNKLFYYHKLVMEEMARRNYKPDEKWLDMRYRGMKCEPYLQLQDEGITNPIYPEHNHAYLLECLENLERKGIII